MKIRMLWIALAVVYLGLAWCAVSTIMGAFIFGVVFSGFGLVFLPSVLLILVLCLIGVHDIRQRLK